MKRVNRLLVAPLLLVLGCALVFNTNSSYAAPAAKDPPAPKAAEKTAAIDLNTATAEELESLPGVGEVTAKKIIAGRPYKSVEDLTAAGLTTNQLAKIRDLVMVKAASKTTKTPAPTSTEPKGKPVTTEKVGKVDLNTATAQELEELPGVGPATSKKIIAGRPYKTVSDLANAGVSESVISKLEPLVTIARSTAPKTAVKVPAPGAKVPDDNAPAGEKINLNTATAKELEELPGVGTVTAKKIVDGRPYKAVADLGKAGVSEKVLENIQDLVTVGRAPVVKAPAKVPSQPDKSNPADTTASAEKIDLNNATAKELEALPGVGPVNAKKIVDGRPYKAVGDLADAGVGPSVIAKIESLVTVGKKATAKSPAKESTDDAAAASSTTPKSKPAPKETTEEPTVSRTPPKKGMVWVNSDSKIFHREEDRWYGKTKEGSFMTEADAIKAGYRESKLTKDKDDDADSAK